MVCEGVMLYHNCIISLLHRHMFVVIVDWRGMKLLMPWPKKALESFDNTIVRTVISIQQTISVSCSSCLCNDPS